MLVFGSLGLNIPAALVAKYRIVLTAQHISVDGVRYSVDEITLDDVDRWFVSAKVFPFVLGTSAAELIVPLKEALERDREILVVTGSRKMLGTYDSAIAAARTIKHTREHWNSSVDVLDSMMLDFGGGLTAVYCASALARGVAPNKVADAARLAVSGSVQCFVPHDLNVIKQSGRASFLKVAAANLMGLVPLLSLEQGDLKSVGVVSRGTSRVKVITDYCATRIRADQPVWAYVGHGNIPLEARELEAALRARFDVRYMTIRPAGPAAYVSVGAKVLCAAMLPVAEGTLSP